MNAKEKPPIGSASQYATLGGNAPTRSRSGEMLVPQQSDERERQSVPFHERHKTENIMIDKRLLKAYQELLQRKGRNKTAALNRIILEACLSEGIQVDPHLFEKPFSFEDV